MRADRGLVCVTASMPGRSPVRVSRGRRPTRLLTIALLAASAVSIYSAAPAARSVKLGSVGVRGQAAPDESRAVSDNSRAPDSEAGIASWYARGLRHPDALTAASRDWPRGTLLRVTRDGGRSVVVRINDYGPQARTGRIIDLARGSFRALASPRLGLIHVSIEQVEAS